MRRRPSLQCRSSQARDDAREDLQRSRHRRGKLLLRLGLHRAFRNGWPPLRSPLTALSHAPSGSPLPPPLALGRPPTPRSGHYKVSATHEPETLFVEVPAFAESRSGARR